MINISLLSGVDLHKDLKIKVGGMNKEILADSYYFFINLSERDKPKFRKLFLEFLQEVFLKIEGLKVNEQINIPICLYDEYTDFISIKNFNSQGVCNLYFCSAYVEGWNINPWIDFSFDLDKELIFAYQGGIYCNLQEILKGLKESMITLEK